MRSDQVRVSLSGTTYIVAPAWPAPPTPGRRSLIPRCFATPCRPTDLGGGCSRSRSRTFRLGIVGPARHDSCMSRDDQNLLRCLVLNAGGTYLQTKTEAVAWAVAVAADPVHRPDLAFIQEVPSQAWLDAWCEQDYRVILGHQRGWKVRSAILTRLDEAHCAPLTPQELPELEYHGEYVAAARLKGWDHGGGDLTVLSVHASPNPASDEHVAVYPAREAIRRRDGGADPRHRGLLFDADVVLETIARAGPAVLACGDLNEARGWDDLPQHTGHTWGAEFFGTRTPDGQLIGGSIPALGLVEVALSDDGSEVVTRRKPGHPWLQLDHIITTAPLATLIHDIAVDPAWTAGTREAAGLADHAPIRFTLTRATSQPPAVRERVGRTDDGRDISERS